MKRFFFPAFVALVLSASAAWADSSCQPISKAFVALAESPSFILLEADAKASSEKVARMEGRNDAVYLLRSGDLVLPDPIPVNRTIFAEQLARDWESDNRQCVQRGEETLNGKAMQVYTIAHNKDPNMKDFRVWIGADDGLLYQFREAGLVSTVEYK